MTELEMNFLKEVINQRRLKKLRNIDASIANYSRDTHYYARQIKALNEQKEAVPSVEATFLELQDYLLFTEECKTIEAYSRISLNGISAEQMQYFLDNPSQFRNHNAKIVATTYPVILHGVSFNTFNIEIRLREFIDCEHSFTRIIPNASINSSNPHPHMSGGSLCWGEASRYYDENASLGNLVWFLRTLNAIMHTYNSSSPYRSIERYSGYRQVRDCSECKNSFDWSTRIHCSICSEAFCRECNIAKCPCCNTQACSKCLLKSFINENDVFCMACKRFQRDVTVDRAPLRIYFKSVEELAAYEADKNTLRKRVTERVRASSLSGFPIRRMIRGRWVSIARRSFTFATLNDFLANQR